MNEFSKNEFPQRIWGKSAPNMSAENENENTDFTCTFMSAPQRNLSKTQLDWNCNEFET